MVTNGRSTKLWTNKWLMKDCVKDHVLIDVYETILNKYVVEYWDSSQCWKGEEIYKIHNPIILDRLDAQVLHNDMNACDGTYWCEEALGEFTVSSAYHIATLADKREDSTL